MKPRTVLVAALASLAAAVLFTACPPPVNPDSAVAVESVSLDKASLSLAVGETGQLTATVTPAGATDTRVTWSSSDEAVATVSETGLVTAKAAGSATVTVKTTDGGKSAACAVTVEIPVTPTTDAFLSSLSLSVGGAARDIGFTKSNLAYKATVPYETTEVVIAAVPSNKDASVSGIGIITLGDAGTTKEVAIIVTATNGTTKKTYTLSIRRADQNASNDATLTSLNLKTSSIKPFPVTISPEFSSTTYEYTSAKIPYENGSITLTATPADTNAAVNGTGNIVLALGINTLRIVVTAADGVTQKTYTISVERFGQESSKLAALSTSGLSLNFFPSMLGYSIVAPYALDSTTVLASAEYPGSKVEIDIGNGEGYKGFTGSQKVDLKVGDTKIKLQVTSEFMKASSEYTLDIKRADQAASSNTGLTSLGIKPRGYEVAIGLTPVFDTGTTAYTSDVPSYVSSIIVDATSISGGSVRSGHGYHELSVGQNTIVVEALAADGTTVKPYTITLTRANPPTIVFKEPAAGSTITGGSTTFTGTLSDPNGEVSSLYITSGAVGAPITATNGDFSVQVDTSSMANGEHEFTLFAVNAKAGAIATASRTYLITGGTTGYTVSASITFEDGRQKISGYLSVLVGEGMSLLSNKVLDSADSPYQLEIPNVSKGSYQVFAIILSSKPYTYGGVIEQLGMVQGFDVVDKDVDLGVAVLGKASSGD